MDKTCSTNIHLKAITNSPPFGVPASSIGITNYYTQTNGWGHEVSFRVPL